MRSDSERLGDILTAINDIERYAVKGFDGFFSDELVQVWVVHKLQIVGEAAAHLSKELRERSADIPWSDIKELRNIIAHHYFGVDLDEVWATVVNDLPFLKERVKALQSQAQAGQCEQAIDG